MFIEYRLEKLIRRITADFAIPLRVVLWNGHEFSLAAEPTVTVYIPTLSALRYFMPPDLNKLGVAFVNGRIRVEGSIHEIFRIAESLVSSVAANKPARLHLFRRHSHKRDREAITMSPTSSIRCSWTGTWFIHALITGTKMTHWKQRRNRNWTTF
jgi:cyclopropane-fatty-acyl-phospholipid synthase